MFKHIFKLIWNKKKQNFLLSFEMLISFLVMFAIFSMMVNYYRSYRTPMGFNDQRVWVVNYDNHVKFGSTDSMTQYYELLRKTVLALPNVQGASFASSNIPFANSTNRTGFTYKGQKIGQINNYRSDAGYRDVLSMKIVAGRWFSSVDKVTTQQPVVVNETLKGQLFGSGEAIGQIIGDDNQENGRRMKVIGVVQDMKDKGDYYRAGPGLYSQLDTGAFRYLSNLLIRVAPDADAAFESRLYKVVTGYMTNASVEIQHLDKRRDEMNRTTLIPVVCLLIVAGFLIINVALGLFGVLWYTINKRKAEIGLRRAIGASGNAVSSQIVLESLVLATLSITVGLFFTVQFPLLHVFNLPAVVYGIAMVMAVVFIYLLVLVCSFYPGKQAAGIYPAVALHED